MGATLVLTSGIDVLKGTSGNDVFIAGDDAGSASLNAGDTINGGTGTDTLKIFNTKTVDNAAQFEHATVTNVEKVEVTFGDAGQKLNVSGNADVQNVTVVNGTGGEVSLGLKQQAGVTGTVGATTFVFQDTTGAADSATLNLNSAAVATVTIADIETLNVVATGTNSVTDLAATAATKLVITGAGSLSAKLTSTATKTIDGSAATGDLVIDNLAAAAGVQNIKTGEGNDIYTTTFANLDKGSKIDLGSGVNTLVFKDAVNIDNAASLSVTNVQVIQAVGAGAFTVDGSQVSTTKFEVGTTGVATFTELAQNSTVILDAVTVAASTAGMKLGAGTLNLNLVGDTTGVVNAVAGVEVTGSTVVNVNSAGKEFGANVLTLTTAENNVINVSGSQDLTLTTANKGGVTGLTIDGSTFTGKLNVTGTAQADIIKGGSGDDIITASLGLDILTGGAGKDTFVFGVDIIGTGNISTITDFASGDKLDLKLATGDFVKAKVDVSGAADLATALGLADNTNANVSWFNFDGSTYVVAAGKDTDVITDDTIVKLAGTLDLSDATFVSGVLTAA